MFTKNVDDGSDEEVVARKFHGDSAGLDDVDDDYLDHGDGDYDEELDVINFIVMLLGLMILMIMMTMMMRNFMV